MLSCSLPLKLSPLLAALGLAALGLLTPLCAPAQAAVLTQNNDNARTGANLAERGLTPAAVGGGHFGKLFTITGLNAHVSSQALYVPRVAMKASATGTGDGRACGVFYGPLTPALPSMSYPAPVPQGTGAAFVITAFRSHTTKSMAIQATLGSVVQVAPRRSQAGNSTSKKGPHRRRGLSRPAYAVSFAIFPMTLVVNLGRIGLSTHCRPIHISPSEKGIHSHERDPRRSP